MLLFRCGWDRWLGSFEYDRRAQVALLAMEVGQSALGALRSVSAALDVQERLIAPRVQPKNAVEPVAPDTPQLLPAVAMFWGTLAASLKARCRWSASLYAACALTSGCTSAP